MWAPYILSTCECYHSKIVSAFLDDDATVSTLQTTHFCIFFCWTSEYVIKSQLLQHLSSHGYYLNCSRSLFAYAFLACGRLRKLVTHRLHSTLEMLTADIIDTSSVVWRLAQIKSASSALHHILSPASSMPKGGGVVVWSRASSWSLYEGTRPVGKKKSFLEIQP